MLIIKKSFSFNPYIEVVNPKADLRDVLQYIDEYIHDKARKTIVQGEPVRVLHLSGLAEYHHNELAHYLKSNQCNCAVESGDFGDTPIKHCWLKVGELLIDLTLKQFESCTHAAPDFLRKLFNTHCYISDNPKSLIYQLYQKTDD